MSDKYFDAFLYVANWGTRWLMLKVPRNLVDVDLVNKYCPGDSAVIHEKEDYFSNEAISPDEESFYEACRTYYRETKQSLISVSDEIFNEDMK